MNKRYWFGHTLLPLAMAILFWMDPSSSHAQVQGWCEEKYLVQASTMDQRVSLPAIAAENDDVYIAYRQNGIKLIHSADRGKTWSEPKEVSGDQNVSRDPAIAVLGSKVVVVFSAYIRVQSLTAYQLFSVESTDKGQVWTNPKRISQTRDHTFSPRILKNGDQAIVAWMETPLSETLGGVSGSTGTAATPEALEEIFNSGFASGNELIKQQQKLRTRIFSSVYTANLGSFSTPVPIKEVFSRTLPYIFTLYGPLDGKFVVTVNENLDIRSYETEDEGQNWSQTFDEPKFFDPQILLDIDIVDGKRYATWIQHKPYQQIAVKFLTDSVRNSLQLSPPHYVRSVPRLTYSGNVFHAVWEAGNQQQSQLTYMRTDKIPPTSNIVRPTSPNIKEQKATFGWVGEDNISDTNRLMYSYSYDGDTWTQPQAETTAEIVTPKDGEYTFRVRAEDVAGNIQNPVAEFGFNTFQSAPNTTLKSTPSPLEELNTRIVRLEFDSADNSDSPSQITYSAQADDNDWTEFASGDSHTFKNLSNGQHILRIRTKDSRGNIDPTPAECMVMIKVGLELVLESKPPLNTNGDELVFNFTAKDDKGRKVKVDTFYRLDGGQEQEIDGENSLSLTGLDEGRHEISLWGVDPSGDKTSEVDYQWTVDRTPPDTVAAFTKEYTNGMPMISLSAQDPMIQGNIKPVTPNRYEYKIGNGDWQTLDHRGGNWPIPKPLSFISWGYVLSVRAIDVAGNVDQTPTSIDLRLFSRTNPYILYSVAAVLGIVIVFILRTLMAGRSRVVKSSPAVATSSGSDIGSTGFESDLAADSDADEPKKPSFSFDDDDDDPYA